MFPIERSVDGSTAERESVYRAMTARSNSSRGAFTLLEIMLVILMAGLIAGVALAMWGDSDATAALAGARIVLQDLEFAQSEAICRRSEITVTFDVGNNSYTVSDSSGPITNPITHQPYVVNLNEAAGGGGVHLSEVHFGGGNGVSFNSLGEPVLPGTDIPISSGDGVSVSCGTASHSVTITPVIGKITAQ